MFSLLMAHLHFCPKCLRESLYFTSICDFISLIGSMRDENTNTLHLNANGVNAYAFWSLPADLQLSGIGTWTLDTVHSSLFKQIYVWNTQLWDIRKNRLGFSIYSMEKFWPALESWSVITFILPGMSQNRRLNVTDWRSQNRRPK